ncbi:Uncharacterized protein ESCO_002189 [Escovopsis weberi]|uniref:CBF1-interacting co-repressor CIR N-terminal domain-containing protein n=1 Tax=Escovopsis weberi TaxID=150374 RepID=A0A0M8N388_ESCWE|nr:Uncharacterized protein ESCO_002189 [Escovopsis weberi]
MPLHLLGKKSWNVYNADNIARVRRDEAAARAAEEAEERRMQEIDAERRLAILRGEAHPPLPEDEFYPSQDVVAADAARSRQEPALSGSGPRKRRKRAGEDDTDFEMRLARERSDAKHDGAPPARLPTSSSAALVDESGHISLFGDQRSRARAEKNEEAEAEAKKKQREFENQYTMRFSNAAGREGLARPWYSQADGAAPDASSKDVWGNDDSNRRQRDAQRIVSGDPLAMMKKGASQVRDLKRERKRVQEERDEDLRQLKSGIEKTGIG